MRFRRLRRRFVYRTGVPQTVSAPKRRRGWTVPLIIGVIIVFTAIIILTRLRPVVREMAEYTVSAAVLRMMNEAIGERIASGGLDYEKLATLEKDENGNITALVTNMAKINVLQTEITNSVIKKISENMSAELKIPIGNIIGGDLFMGRGPKIPVRIISVTNAEASFSNQFSSAGINQTRHQIMLSIKVNIGLLIPGSSTSTTVETQMVIAETVIVGAVPDTYADIGGQKQ